MALIGNLFNIEKLDTSGLVNVFKKFFDQPKWLLTLLLAAIMGTMLYFSIRYHQDVNQIDEMIVQVDDINKKVNNTIDIEIYINNQLYVVTEIRLLQQAEEQMYKEQILQLDLLCTYIQKHNPNDPVIADFMSMKSRLENNHQIYRQHYDYVLERLSQSLKDSTQVLY